jgi:glycosyltransferase involved in cell wall biosynthesis
LRQQGHELLLISFKRQYPDWLFPGQSDRDPSCSVLPVEGAHYWLNPWNPLTWIATFCRIHHHRPHMLVMQWWTPWWAPAWFVLGALNRLALGTPQIYLCHNVLPHEAHWWDPLVARMVLCWGAGFVVQSEGEQRRLQRFLPQARATVFPLPVMDLWSEQSVPKEQARLQLGLPTDVPLLLFFGMVREYKGLQDLLAAIPSIRARLGPLMLLVAGEFWTDPSPYLEMIQRLGIEDEVRLDNRYIPNEEAILLFSAADLLVAPYRAVTGSAVVQLARGFGLPAVTTRLGGLAEVTEGALGLLAPPSDPDGLAATIVRYFEDGLEARLRQRIQEGRHRDSWEELVALLQKLAQEGQS